MASVWKRLQRVNKRAAKFQYTASYHRIDLETSAKWTPHKLSVVWTRRSRRVMTDPLDWEPSLKDPLKGSVIFAMPENQSVAVTLFKDSRTNELEDKDWTFVLEDVSPGHKRRRLASCAVNMRKYASLEPSQRTLTVTLDPCTRKVAAAGLTLTLHCVLLREGQATDEDMQSLASLLSVNNNSDIAVLEDLDEDDYTMSDNSTRQMLDLRHQMEEMTQSLTSSDIAATPCSVQSLALDGGVTPTAPPADGNTETAYGKTDSGYGKSDSGYGKSDTGFGKSDTGYGKSDTAYGKSDSAYGKSETGYGKSDTEYGKSDTAYGKSDTAYGKSDTGYGKRDTGDNKGDTAGETPGDKRDRPHYLAHLTNMAKGTTNLQSSKPEPLFSSTPVKATSNETDDSSLNEPLKSFVFKPTQLAKYNLKPLDLKINLNNIGLDRNQNGKDSPEDKDKTPVNELDAAFPGKFDRDKTPVQDLLEWCQSVTADYRQCRVTNLTTSFRSGLALCAIIHHFRPELIDFSGLQPEDHLGCARAALEASAKLGVSPVISASDIAAPLPDKLAIMTYLFQLRAHFTGSELQVEQLGSEEGESSYLVGRHDTDAALPRDLFNSEISARRSMRRDHKPNIYRQMSSESCNSDTSPDKPSSPAIKDLLHHSKNILGKVLSGPRSPPQRQASAKWFTDPLGASRDEPPLVRPEKLMTRKELTDPFGSDEEDDPQPPSNGTADHASNCNSNSNSNGDDSCNGNAGPVADSNGTLQQSPLQSTVRSASSPAVELPRPPPQLLSRHDELKERARQLLEATKREAREKERHRLLKAKEREQTSPEANGGLENGETSPSKKPMTEEERQAMLRERARKLIADARAGIVSPTSPLSPSRSRAGGVVEIISKQSVMDEIAAAGGAEQLDALLRSSPPSTPRSNGSERSPEPQDPAAADRSGSGSERGRSPLRTIGELMADDDLLDESAEREGGSYIAGELAALEREQSAIDKRAAALEILLRRVMEDSDNTQEESRLMSQWFNLVNKKNALIRRQMQLNILEQEEDLSRRCELLARELRLSLGVDEWRKTPGQKRRERLLLQELVSAVNERDRLVQEMDEQEKAIANDDKIKQELTHMDLQRKNNCILQ